MVSRTEAAEWFASSACSVACLQGALRTKETIESFKRVPAQPGQTSPLLVYFGEPHFDHQQLSVDKCSGHSASAGPAAGQPSHNVSFKLTC